MEKDLKEESELTEKKKEKKKAVFFIHWRERDI